MIVAHAPAGYIIGKIYEKCLSLDKKTANSVVVSAVGGSLFPDLDLFYQHFVDDMKINHHFYPTHIPAYWAGIIIAFILISLLSKRVSHSFIAFFLGVMSHLVLDTPLGGIMWKFPFDMQLINFFDIPTIRNPYKLFDYYDFQVKGWLINIVEHTSFHYEIGIVAAAATLWVVSCAKSLIKRP